MKPAPGEKQRDPDNEGCGPGRDGLPTGVLHGLCPLGGLVAAGARPTPQSSASDTHCVSQDVWTLALFRVGSLCAFHVPLAGPLVQWPDIDRPDVETEPE